MISCRSLTFACLVTLSTFVAPGAVDAQVVTLQQTLQSPNSQGGGRFAAVAVEGTVAVVGAWRESVGANAVQGSAYVFVFNGTSWVQRQRLVASDGAFADQFGSAVAISGNTILVGALGKQNVAGPDYNFGAAYVFVNNGTSWVQQAKLVASDTTAGSAFGAEVALQGDTAVIGAYLGQPGGTGARTGTAYVFERSGSTWTQQRLDGGDHQANDSFGRSVGISGSAVCVGSRRVLGNGARSGAVYVFTKSGSTWGLQQKVVSPTPVDNDLFGASCSLDGDALAIGAPGEAGGGGVYVANRTGTVWSVQEHLTPGGNPTTAALGSDVDLRGDLLVAGAAGEQFLGAVYFFERSAGTFVERQKVVNTTGTTNDGFGLDVAQDGVTALAGAPNEVSNSRPGFVSVFRRATSTGVPGAPQNLQGTVTGNLLSLSWGAPSTGTATSYTLIARTTSGAPIVSVPVGNTTSFSAGAPNGAYRLTVQASNAAGAGPESNAITVTVPSTTPVPGAPAGLTATVAGNTVTFNWVAPSTGGAATGYLLAAGVTAGFAAPIATLPLPAAPTSYAVPGVPPGTYYVRLAATNAGGSGAASNEVAFTVAGPTAPLAPVLNPASVSGSTVSLSWTPGGGGAPTSYVLAAALSPGGVPFVTAPLGATPSVSFTGVPAGTYYVRVVAANAVGTSAPSNEIAIVVR